MFKFLGGIILFFFSFFVVSILLGIGVIKYFVYSHRNKTRRGKEEYVDISFSKKGKNKVFDDNDGEYVDFEELD